VRAAFDDREGEVEGPGKRMVSIIVSRRRGRSGAQVWKSRAKKYLGFERVEGRVTLR
jgi:hypothetical protein